MNITNFKLVAPYLMKARVACMMHGPAGIGKTSIMKQLAKELGYNFIYLTLAAVEDNSDLIGLLSPIKDNTGNDIAVRHLKPDWFPTSPKNIIFIDEANRMPKSVIQSMLTFILDHKLHTHYLPEDSHIFLASNPPSDEYVVGDFSDKALISRICHLALEPSTEEFLEYCASSGKSDDVISFIQENPELLEAKEDAYLPAIKPNRRTWADLVSPFLNTHPPKHVIFEVVKGLVGTEAAVRFDTHLKSSIIKVKGKGVLKDYNKILQNRIRENENNLDVINIVCEEIIREIKLKGKITKKEADNVGKFLMDIPIERCYNATRSILSLGLESVNKTLGENKELIERVSNKLEELSKTEEK